MADNDKGGTMLDAVRGGAPCPATVAPKDPDHQKALHDFKRQVANGLQELYAKTPPHHADPAIAHFLQGVLDSFHKR